MHVRGSRAVLVAVALSVTGCTSDAKVSIEIIPEMTTVIVGATEKLACTVTVETSSSYLIDGNRSASTWTTDDTAGGTLTEDVASSVFMVYTPATTGEFHVTCAAVEDPDVVGIATITVVAP
ncbi:MAG: hypothetical protein AB7O24_20330 [Kofleriaceae bacterium]